MTVRDYFTPKAVAERAKIRSFPVFPNFLGRKRSRKFYAMAEWGYGVRWQARKSQLKVAQCKVGGIIVFVFMGEDEFDSLNPQLF